MSSVLSIPWIANLFCDGMSKMRSINNARVWGAKIHGRPQGERLAAGGIGHFPQTLTLLVIQKVHEICKLLLALSTLEEIVIIDYSNKNSEIISPLENIRQPKWDITGSVVQAPENQRTSDNKCLNYAYNHDNHFHILNI